MASKASRFIKLLRGLPLPRMLLGMDTTSKAIIRVTSNPLLKLLRMVIRPQHMLSKVTRSRHTLNNLCTVDTHMRSLLRVISKLMVSKVSKDMLRMDNLKLGTLLHRVMGLPQQLLVAMITMLLLLEVLLQFQSAKLQLCLPPKAKGKWLSYLYGLLTLVCLGIYVISFVLILELDSAVHESMICSFLKILE
jgi:hypothetical protein